MRLCFTGLIRWRRRWTAVIVIVVGRTVRPAAGTVIVVWPGAMRSARAVIEAAGLDRAGERLAHQRLPGLRLRRGQIRQDIFDRLGLETPERGGGFTPGAGRHPCVAILRFDGAEFFDLLAR